MQTPAGAGEILLQANQVDIRLGSTAFLRAVPGDSMTVDVIEGHGSVTALGTTVVVPAGARAQIPLNDDGLPAGPPELVVYTEDDVAFLPVSILPDAVEIAAPLDESVLLENSIEGTYMWVEDFPAYYCGNDSGRVSADASGAGVIFRIERTETGIRFTIMDNGSTNELSQTGPGVFTSTFNEAIDRVGTSTSTVRVEWTSASGGVWTTTTDYDYVYCNETIERTAAFARVENPGGEAN